MTLRVNLISVFLLLVASAPARAAFDIADGLDPAYRAKVSLAVVRVAAVRPASATPCQGFRRVPCIDLQVVRMVQGTRPAAQGLQSLPFATMADTAWTPPRGKLLGALYLMAWVHGQPCGSGLAASLGRHVMLPYELTDASDPLVAAATAVLAATAAPAKPARRAALDRLFTTGSAAEARLADGGLLDLDPGHARSARRYERLLALVDPHATAGCWLAEAVLIELSRMPVPRDASAWARWAGVTAPAPAAFLAFRSRVQRRLIALAARTTARPTLRALALVRLGEPPVRLGLGDDLERATAERLRMALTLTTGEVRREVFRSLHAYTRGSPRWDRHFTEGLLKTLRVAAVTEKDPAERRVLQRILSRR